jgi:hypothetical protein
MASKVFRRVAGLHPGRSVFDLSYDKKFTCDMGQLIPVLCEEMVPGDRFNIANEIVIRFQPLVAPIMHEINCYVHYFFVPYRLLWEDWEDFISGGVEGDFDEAPPLWDDAGASGVTAIGSLWDYFGFPIGVNPAGAYPLAFPRRAYNLVYNEYYRDENLQDEVELDQNLVLNRAWEKDYFTSALPWQQRGIAPALPVTGVSSAEFLGSFIDTSVGGAYPFFNKDTLTMGPQTNSQPLFGTKLKEFLDNNQVDLSNLTTFDVSDLRLAFQIQKWMERNARAGARYTEFLRSHFGVSPRDERLQRPEYVGGSKSPIIISEVLQTSESGSVTPQGNLAGHGITIDRTFAGKYFAQEFGCIIGIMSVMPRSAYQQGIDRQWLRRTRYDFYFPEFANLSEQAIEQAEIIATDDAVKNKKIFGYQGRYDEMRVKRSMICGQMRSYFNYWHLGRTFDPANPPLLNEDFIKCVPRKDIFAVPSEPGLIVNFGNILRSVRPMPIESNPGLIDHR